MLRGSVGARVHARERRREMGCCVQLRYVQVMTSRLMEQLSEPAVLLALQMYFPDMLLVRLLSRRVPYLSSAEQTHSQNTQICTLIWSLKRRSWS